MSKQPRIEDIPSGIIDVDPETDRFEQWYCWVRNFDLVEWRKEQAELKADNRKDNVVHHCRCTWLNAKRDAVNQRKAFMAAHDKLVAVCEAIKNSSDNDEFDHAFGHMPEALAAVKAAT